MRRRPSSRFAIPLALSLLVVAPASAKFSATVTKAKAYDPSAIAKVAVITTECHEVVDCGRLERRIVIEAQEMPVSFTVVPEEEVREFLFAEGHLSFTPELRGVIAEAFGIDAFLELRVPFAERGDGFAGNRRSSVKIELLLTKVDGAILLHGVGTGRPLNVVSSPERVAGNVVEEIFMQAFESR
ncbi:MAG: hypothetical protein AAGC60_10045 [Acidobacteriota bacterium]